MHSNSIQVGRVGDTPLPSSVIVLMCVIHYWSFLALFLKELLKCAKKSAIPNQVDIKNLEMVVGLVEVSLFHTFEWHNIEFNLRTLHGISTLQKETMKICNRLRKWNKVW